MVIKRIGPLSCARIVGTLYIFVGLAIGGVISLVAVAGGFASQTSEAPFVGAFVGAGSIVLFPLFYGCIGFLSALIGAWLYNLLAGFVGGIQIEVQ
jgi:hypothetical protein